MYLKGFVFLSLLLLLSLSTVRVGGNHHGHGPLRRVLHQPFFPTQPQPQPPSASPQPQPQPQPKHPFSTTPTGQTKSFFPSLHSPPPPPPPPIATPTFPANISSILLPRSSSSSSHRHLLIVVAASLLSVAAVVAVIAAFLFLRHRRRPYNEKPKNPDNVRLFPPNTAPSDSPSAAASSATNGGGNHSAEFLYLGTLVNPNEPANVDPRVSSSYQKLGSPELRPLPPLPRRKSGVGGSDNEEEEFFSPRGSSSGRNEDSPPRNDSSLPRYDSSSRRVFGGIEVDNFGSRSCNSRTASYPYSNPMSPAISNLSSPSQGPNFSPRSVKSKSGLARSLSSSSMESNSKNMIHSPNSNSGLMGQNDGNLNNSRLLRVKLPPPPPPLPPAGYWENPIASRPAVVMQVKSEQSVKLKLKPLHWDKVRASSDRAMVWDQLKSSSFQ